MISLSVYLIPKKGRELELDSAVRDGWLPAMSEQPGFLAAAVVRPYEPTELEALGGLMPHTRWRRFRSGARNQSGESGLLAQSTTRYSTRC